MNFKKRYLLVFVLLLLFFILYFLLFSSKPVLSPGSVLSTIPKSVYKLVERGEVAGLTDDKSTQEGISDDISYISTPTPKPSDKEEEKDKNDDKEEDSNDDNDENTDPSPTPTPIPTLSDLQLLQQKANSITTTVASDTNFEIENTFVPALVEFYGDNLNVVFDFDNITFSNCEITEVNYGMCNAEITLGNVVENYNTYFYYENSNWLLYKTEAM